MTNRTNQTLNFAADLLDHCDDDIESALDTLDLYALDATSSIPDATIELIAAYDPSDSDIDLIARIYDALT